MKGLLQTVMFGGCFAVGVAAAAQVVAPGAPLAPGKMTFFITSKGGDGGNLGGLSGADKICTALATAAGAPPRQWRAYLSTSARGGQAAVDARDRIGRGPWYNARGQQVGRDVADLHRPGSPINKETGLDERGATISGRGDTPNRHDILTGSTVDGRAAGDLNCGNWTSNGSGEKTRVGHFDRTGGGDAPASWASAHPSRGCSMPELQATGGEGLFYCFAAR